MFASDDEGSEGEEIDISKIFLDIEYKWHKEFQNLELGLPIKYVYDPLEYAQEIHMNFIKKYLNLEEERVLFVGMNPGPWGMCQTGVPLGDARTVKNWFGIRGKIKWFKQNLSNRVVTGLNCEKIDDGGRKFWNLIKKLCGKPENFFKHCLIHNYCPLAFYTEAGKVLTLPDIKGYNTQQLFQLCDSAIVDIIVQLQIKKVVALGKFIEKRVLEALETRNITNIKVGYIPHPASTHAKYRANWESITIQRLKDLDVYRLLIEV